jgi:signal transduction histidine kinase
LKLVFQPVDIKDVIEKAVGSLMSQAKDKEINLVADLPEDLPLVETDAERLGQVLRNLLKNAIVNTPPGGEIRIQARTVVSQVEVSVQDNGIGISAEHLPYVFERFYRADKSRARTTGGAGLGLAIVKQLVEAQGGQVAIDSQVNAGTRVTFTSPIADLQ